MERAFLGIDIGTSATKVLALSEHGTTLAKARRSYPTHAPQTNWAEQSAEDWWTATAAAVADVMGQLEGRAIAGVGLSGQLNGFVLTDGAGAPLHKALIWLDLRAAEEADELSRRMGREIEAISGNRLSPIAVMPKLLWMRRHRAEIVGRAKRIFLVKDYILWRLTGVHATDPSDGSATNLMGLEERQWSVELCDAVGIDSSLLPIIIGSSAIAGQVSRSASAATRIPQGVPVVPGGGDVAALAAGCGVIAESVLGLTLGTAGHVVLSSSRPLPSAQGGLWQIVHMVEGRMVWLGLVMAGGLSLSWIHRVMSLGQPAPSFDEFVALADAVEPGARGLVFLPFLEGAATPYERPNARASFVGLTSSHGAAEMVQAVMEGVAFNLRECVELFEGLGARVTEVRLAEGGSKVGRWCQIIADVLRRPVDLVAESDTSALGAAMAAQAGVMGLAIEAIAPSAVRISGRFEPGPAAPAYQPIYARYRELAAVHMGSSGS